MRAKEISIEISVSAVQVGKRVQGPGAKKKKAGEILGWWGGNALIILPFCENPNCISHFNWSRHPLLAILPHNFWSVVCVWQWCPHCVEASFGTSQLAWCLATFVIISQFYLRNTLSPPTPQHFPFTNQQHRISSRIAPVSIQPRWYVLFRIAIFSTFFNFFASPAHSHALRRCDSIEPYSTNTFNC